MALVKYNNNSISAITTAGTLATGAMVLIKSITASSSSTISFVDGSSDVVLDNTYPIYLFELINIHPQTDIVRVTFQGSTDGGSSYGVTATTTNITDYHSEGGSSLLAYEGGNDQAQSTDEIRLQGGGLTGADNDQSLCAKIFLFSPSNTTFVKHFSVRLHHSERSDYAESAFLAGYFNTTSAIDAMRFKCSSGNIAAGKIKLYGIKDS